MTQTPPPRLPARPNKPAGVPKGIDIGFMPTYEYHCEKCGHEFEAFQSISAKPLKNCPKELCAQKKWGRGRVKKKISGGSGLLFKGSGFYITDYRSQKYKEAAKKESAPAGDAKPAKSESKPSPSPPKEK